jgi:hypothetical protein
MMIMLKVVALVTKRKSVIKGAYGNYDHGMARHGTARHVFRLRMEETASRFGG